MQIKIIIKQAIKILLIFSVVCGIGYTVLITIIAQSFFPNQANGEIISIANKSYGSMLLGQYTSSDKHLWGRVMNLDVQTYKDHKGNPLMYGVPSNSSPASDNYQDLIKSRVQQLREKNPQQRNSSVPVALVTESASGLDPHISPAAAMYQIPRIAKATGKSYNEVKNIIEKCKTERFLGIFGESTINVLKANLMLDGIIK